MSVACNVFKEILFDSYIDLFSGRAYHFFQVGGFVVRMLLEEYQHADCNEQLFNEIKRRTQDPHESIGIYLAVMSGYFKRVTYPISKEVKLKILLHNITRQLGLVEVTLVLHYMEETGSQEGIS